MQLKSSLRSPVKTSPPAPPPQPPQQQRAKPSFARTLVAGREVVGRAIAVFSAKTLGWTKGTVLDFDADKQLHRVRYQDRGNREEQWLCLGKTQFQWLSEIPAGAQPNPTAAGMPQKEDAIGHKVRVFWPGMCKWYIGKVKEYDPKTGSHCIAYKDGDVQQLVLKHEAVVWLGNTEAHAAGEADSDHDETLGTGSRQPQQNGHSRRSTADSPQQQQQQQGARAQQAAANGASSGDCREGEQGSTSTGTRKRPACEAGPAGCSPRCSSSPRSTQDCFTQHAKRSKGSSPTLAAAPPQQQPVESADSDALSQDHQQSGPGDTARSPHPGFGSPVQSPRAHGHMVRNAAANSTFRALLDEEAHSIASSSDAETDDMDMDVDVEAESDGYQARHQRGSSGLLGKRPKSGKSGLSLKHKSQRAADRDHRNRASKLRLGSARRKTGLGGVRRVRPDRVRGNDTVQVARAGQTAVGARVAIFWPADESYYKGELTAYDSYHKRCKIIYDDGEEEWLALQREAFKWLIPRGRSAGCSRELREAMACLGADNIDLDAPLEPERGAPMAFPEGSSVFAGDGGRAARSQGSGPASSAGSERENEPIAGNSAPPHHNCAQPSDSATPGQPGPLGPSAPAECIKPEPGVKPDPAAVEASQWASMMSPPQKGAAVGWAVAVYCAADGFWHEGEIMAYDKATAKHHVLYADGEDEWIEAEEEDLRWMPLPDGVRPPAGVPHGEPAPEGRQAEGWRVGVYWKEDTIFYDGEIIGYDPSTGRHEILYDDGEAEYISLSVERVKWVLPPGVHASTDVSQDGEPRTRGRQRSGPKTHSRRLAREGSPGGEAMSPRHAHGPEGHRKLEDHRRGFGPALTLKPQPEPLFVREVGNYRPLGLRHGGGSIQRVRVFMSDAEEVPADYKEPRGCDAARELPVKDAGASLLKQSLLKRQEEADRMLWRVACAEGMEKGRPVVAPPQELVPPCKTPMGSPVLPSPLNVAAAAEAPTPTLADIASHPQVASAPSQSLLANQRIRQIIANPSGLVDSKPGAEKPADAAAMVLGSPTGHQGSVSIFIPMMAPTCSPSLALGMAAGDAGSISPMVTKPALCNDNSSHATGTHHSPAQRGISAEPSVLSVQPALISLKSRPSPIAAPEPQLQTQTMTMSRAASLSDSPAPGFTGSLTSAVGVAGEPAQHGNPAGSVPPSPSGLASLIPCHVPCSPPSLSPHKFVPAFSVGQFQSLLNSEQLQKLGLVHLRNTLSLSKGLEGNEPSGAGSAQRRAELDARAASQELLFGPQGQQLAATLKALSWDPQQFTAAFTDAALLTSRPPPSDASTQTLEAKPAVPQASSGQEVHGEGNHLRPITSRPKSRPSQASVGLPHTPSLGSEDRGNKGFVNGSSDSSGLSGSVSHNSLPRRGSSGTLGSLLRQEASFLNKHKGSASGIDTPDLAMSVSGYPEAMPDLDALLQMDPVGDAKAGLGSRRASEHSLPVLERVKVAQ